jgi:hypothetical protein
MILVLSCVSILFIWARGAYPRIRYDKLIRLTWKQFLPITLVIIIIGTFITVWCCAGRTDNFDVVKHEDLLQHLFLEACNSNEFLLH